MWNTKFNRHCVELQGTYWTRDVKMWIPGSAVCPFQMILHFSSEKKILNGSKIKSKFLHCDKRGFCPWPWGLEDISLALLCLCLSPLRQWVCGPKEICPPGIFVCLWDHTQGVWGPGLSTSDSNGPESLSKDSTVLYPALVLHETISNSTEVTSPNAFLLWSLLIFLCWNTFPTFIFPDLPIRMNCLNYICFVSLHCALATEIIDLR